MRLFNSLLLNRCLKYLISLGSIYKNTTYAIYSLTSLYLCCDFCIHHVYLFKVHFSLPSASEVCVTSTGLWLQLRIKLIIHFYYLIKHLFIYLSPKTLFFVFITDYLLYNKYISCLLFFILWCGMCKCVCAEVCRACESVSLGSRFISFIKTGYVSQRRAFPNIFSFSVSSTAEVLLFFSSCEIAERLAFPWVSGITFCTWTARAYLQIHLFRHTKFYFGSAIACLCLFLWKILFLSKLMLKSTYWMILSASLPLLSFLPSSLFLSLPPIPFLL